MSGKSGRIFDPVYGYIELGETEFALVNSPVFQRLHWIKQLGPLHTVFPSAQHSRFSHTLGVFYIVRKMIEHLKARQEKDKSGYDFRRTEEKELRFAALLHDIGHVPLSHVGERVLQDAAEDEIRGEQGGDTTEIDGFARRQASWRTLFPERDFMGGSTKLHERLSAEMVLYNWEIDRILGKVRGWKSRSTRRRAKEKIAQIIVGMDLTNIPTLLLHSELDADRLDYLLRDSFFTGVWYGKIELDYIISRLCIVRDKDGGANLCIENKGLQTVEHYILGRFFLQTQVIFNRKVRLMDLLFADVMRYMIEAGQGKEWVIMNLQQLRDCIRACKGKDKREHLHTIYRYTDAEIFSKMRLLHEILDQKEKNGETTPEESYINDCIKTIMDGKVAEPVVSHKKLVDLQGQLDYVKSLETEAKEIAASVAKQLGKDGIYSERVKANVVDQEVMKYQKRMGPGRDAEEPNREAVKIAYKNADDTEKFKYAAESNATIVGSLHDKALVLLNVYYIPPKHNANDAEDEANRQKIREAFKRLVETRFQSENERPREPAKIDG